jgi:hypothetical protein
MRVLLLLSLLGCQKKSEPAAFDDAWSKLSEGAEPIMVERGAEELLGEARRVLKPAGDIVETPKDVEGPLPDNQIVQVIRRNLMGVKACYDAEEKQGPVSNGKAIVSIEISPQGKVTEVSVEAPAFATTQLPQCVSGRARSWTFPRSSLGAKKFSYPFVFVSS